MTTQVSEAVTAHENKLRRNKKPKEPKDLSKSRSNSEESFEEISPSEVLELDKILEQESSRMADAGVLEPEDAVSPGLPRRITRAAGNIATAITGALSALARSRSPSIGNNLNDSAIEDDPLLETMMLPCPLDLLKFEVPRDPYLSPYWASDETLSQFPPTHFVTLQMDPCLDDCVEFAKKLKRLGNPTTIDIIDGLSHGFLNFVMLSKEAYEASKKCIQRLSDLLALDSDSNA